FFLHAGWIRQQRPHVIPHRGVEQVLAQRFILTDLLSAKAVGFGSSAAVVAVLALAGGAAVVPSAVGVTAALADQQLRQQVADGALALAVTLAVLGQLL